MNKSILIFGVLVAIAALVLAEGQVEVVPEEDVQLVEVIPAEENSPRGKRSLLLTKAALGIGAAKLGLGLAAG